MDFNATIIGQTHRDDRVRVVLYEVHLAAHHRHARRAPEQIAEGLAAGDKGSRALEEAEVEKAAILDEARGQARGNHRPGQQARKSHRR